jgi:ferredoxin
MFVLVSSNQFHLGNEASAMPKVTFVKEKKTVDVPEGANLRKVAADNGIQLYKGAHRVINCHGSGLCGSCRVYLKDGQENVSQPGAIEKFTTKFGLAFFAYLGHEDELRLACQYRVEGDVEVKTQAPGNWHGEKFWG